MLLDELDQPEEGIALLRECVALRRALCEEKPETHEPQLAGDLYSLGAVLLDRDAPKEAREALAEALRRLEPHARRDPERLGDWLEAFEERYRQAGG